MKSLKWGYILPTSWAGSIATHSSRPGPAGGKRIYNINPYFDTQEKKNEKIIQRLILLSFVSLVSRKAEEYLKKLVILWYAIYTVSDLHMG